MGLCEYWERIQAAEASSIGNKTDEMYIEDIEIRYKHLQNSEIDVFSLLLSFYANVFSRSI
jgi:hypothetical protein